MKVPYVDLPGQYAADRARMMDTFDRVMASGRYILGEEVSRLEARFADYCGTAHAIAVSNGTDALMLAMKAAGIGPGDEVITAANSWISSAAAIIHLGATPVFADVGPDQNLDPKAVAEVITPHTRALMPVHLTGRIAPMTPLRHLAEQHDLVIIEDAAQAVGAVYEGKRAGALGLMGCFSLHPLKNLNAAGDAGMITTDNDDLADHLRLLRNHGLKGRGEAVIWGYNMRLDALQAALVNTRFDNLEEIITTRRAHAARYRAGLRDMMTVVEERPRTRDTNHLFVIQCDRRDQLQAHLKARQIGCAIHYPIPIHLQPAARHLGYQAGDLPVTEQQARTIMSLPVHHMLSAEQIDHVIAAVRAFYQG